MAPGTIKKAETRLSTAMKGKSKVKKPATSTRNKTSARRIDDITKGNETSPLLRLPRELRDMIYEYAIGGNEITTMYTNIDSSSPIVMAGTYNQEDDTEAKWNALLSLSLVCRQLRAETRLLPYRLNVLEIAASAGSCEFLQELKTEFKEAIETVSFGFKRHHNSLLQSLFKYTVPTELQDCKNLKRVIARTTLHPVQMMLVYLFARKRGLKYIVEKDCLPYAPTKVLGSGGVLYDTMDDFLENEG